MFAPTLPVPYATQWPYLNRLVELAEDQRVHGLAVYDVDLLPDLEADYADSLAPLPRLSLHPAPTPHHMLRQIALGADVLLLPMITTASEGGLAFVWGWGEEEKEEEGEDQKALAIDLADPVYKTSLEPLSPGCRCPACRMHHRAYIHHLLDAREMLAWTLLQLHNHHVVSTFLEGVRTTLASSVASFEAARLRFAARYEPELLAVRKAARPRTRGYQQPQGSMPAKRTASEKAAAATASSTVTVLNNDEEKYTGPGRLNKPAWGRLNEVAAAVASSEKPESGTST